ncbi:zinc-binding dehydrogenase [Micromonospora krabiensis]
MVALAATAGARVVVTASTADHDHCRRNGAAVTLDYRAPDLADRLRAACPDGVDVYLDTAGRNELEWVVDLLALRGRVVVLAGGAHRPALPVAELYRNDRSVVGFVISHATVPELAEAARTVNRLLTAGRLAARGTVELPLSEMGEAHRMLEAGELRGRRVVVRP